jgi:hypothetical protein
MLELGFGSFPYSHPELGGACVAGSSCSLMFDSSCCAWVFVFIVIWRLVRVGRDACVVVDRELKAEDIPYEYLVIGLWDVHISFLDPVGLYRSNQEWHVFSIK